MIEGPSVATVRPASSILCGFILIVTILLFPTGLRAGGEKSEWIEVRSPHFTVDSNSGKHQAKMVAQRLELIRETMARVLTQTGNYNTPPLTILAVQDQRSLKRLMPEYFKKRGEAHPAGLFLQTSLGDFIVLRTDLMQPGYFNPVFHEYAHFVMRRLLPSLPPWLSEGLADVYSNTRVEKHVVLMGFPDADNLSELHSRPLIPVRTLLGVDYSSPYYNHSYKVDIFYAESWALAHYLLFQDFIHGTNHLHYYEQQMADGGDPVKTFTKIFGPTKQMDNKLEEYVARVAFPTFRFHLTERASSKGYSVRPLSKAEADADQADFLLADNNRHDAEILTDKALKQNPHLGLANALMSLLMLQTGSRTEAATWAKKAIQFDPTDYHGYYYAALAMQGTRLDTTSLALLERDLEQAIKLQPGLAQADFMLSELYLAGNENLDKALALARDAARSDPENNRYLTTMEIILLKQGRQADAVAVEMEMLGRARTAKQKAMVRNEIGWYLMQQNVAMRRADHEIRVAAQLDPKNADILDSLGFLLRKEGHLEQSKQVYEHALALQPKLFTSLLGLGDILRSQHDLAGAVAEYQKAIAVVPNNARAHYDLSLALQAQGNAAQAASELKAARNLDPFNPRYQ